MEFHEKEFKKITDNDEGFDFKKSIGVFLNYWYLFLISVVSCLLLAFFYAKYATPTYKINSKITIDDQSGSSGGKSIGSSAMMDFSDLLGSPNNAYNEMDILNSKVLMTNVVKELHLNTTIFRNDNIKSVELYDEAPFDVTVISKNDSLLSRLFDIKIEENGLIHIKNSKEDIDKEIKFGEVIQCEQFGLVFNKKPRNVFPRGYKLLVQSIDNKVDDLSNRFTVDLTDKKSTTVLLTFEYPNPRKGEVILQKLINLYLKSNLEIKQQIADSTIEFIDNRLKIVSGELEGVETKFTEFKKNNNIADVDEQGKALVGNVSEYYKKLSDQELQLQILNDVSKFVNNPANNKVIPSSLAMQDQSFADAISAYNQLLVQRSQLELSYKENNPVVKNLDDEIETVRQNLLKSFGTYKNSLVISINALKLQNSNLNAQVKSVPQKERTFLDYTREQTLKEQLYLFLLQKREETAISRTSTISTARIIDPAKSDYVAYKPNKNLVLLIGFVLGLIIPWLYVYFKNLLNIKISNKEDILKQTPITILGEIGNNRDEKALIFKENSRSPLSEQFRALRTNLQFTLKSDKSNVIMITSSMSGEGKSFISLNLASVLALSDKKVVMIELDLRKPKLSASVDIDHNFGFTNYVISNTLKLDDIIKPINSFDNLSIIPSGPIPPNPSELLMSDRLKELINELKNKFDYIIIDSAPIGLVSDAQLIENNVDVCLYIARQGYTLKTQLNILNDLVSSNKFRNAYLVVNDIKLRKGGYHGYGYNYGYGYGYGVESDKPEGSILKRIFKK
jgi:tyrosine-protein kinase Etk/Wzc